MEFVKRKLTAIFLLGIAVFFVYANALLNGFVWDDEEQIVNNTVIRSWSNLPYILVSSTFYAGGAGLSGGFYRPILSLSNMLNYWVWGLEPFGYHLFQIFFHFINVALVYFLLKKIFFSQNIGHGDVMAFLAAILFAVHPANVESVAYIASIGEIFYVLFLLAGFIVLLDGVISGTKDVKAKNLYLFFLLFFLGLLSKETAVVGLPIILIYFYLFVKPVRRAYSKLIFGSGMVFLIYFFLRFFVAKLAVVSAHIAPITSATFFERLITIPFTVFSYLGIIFFPRDLSVSRHFVISSVFDVKFWGALIILGALFSILAYCIYRRKSALGAFFALWFFVAIAPVLNVIPLDMTMAERWLYLPAIGIFAGVSYILVNVIKKMSRLPRRVAYAACLAVVIVLGVRTIIRNGDWKNGLTLYSHDEKIAARIYIHGNCDLENNLGVELFRAGKIEEAGNHFKKSIELQPRWTYSHNNLGAVLEQQQNLDGALAEYEKAIAISDYYLAYENKANMLIRMKRYADAKDFLSSALLKYPQNNKMKFFLAWLYAAKNVSPDDGDRQKSLILLSQILLEEPGNGVARQLFDAVNGGQIIEI
jgi:tetratricopeptide (TPR) repeat protein